MKELIISYNRIKRELIVFGVIVGISFFINVFAISKYKGSWTELYTSGFYVLLIAVFIYILILIPRIIYGILNKRH